MCVMKLKVFGSDSRTGMDTDIKRKEDNKMREDRRVYVYRNLHKDCWSVRQGGRIVAHVDKITLKNARFLVSQAGRNKVLREKRKNVHAGISGYPVDEQEMWNYHSKLDSHARKVLYNPYKYDHFVTEDEYPIIESYYVQLDINRDSCEHVLAITE